jgi:hypothetical protein
MEMTGMMKNNPIKEKIGRGEGEGGGMGRGLEGGVMR